MYIVLCITMWLRWFQRPSDRGWWGPKGWNYHTYQSWATTNPHRR